MTEIPAHTDAPSPPVAVEQPGEDLRSQRRRLAAVWLAAGSAVAGMVAVGWYLVAQNGGQPPGGDMVGHAVTAEWLRNLPWWDWRGWSDWFFGGQAIGVNYPPLGHAWMRFTHPVHGQMAAVLIGLVVLLPWGALRLARSVGYSPRAQRAAVGAVLVLAAVAGNMHWFLSGFHYASTFYGSWQAMIASTLGLFCASWAARCRQPVMCGLVGGIALLFNSTVVPGIAVICIALLVSSGATFWEGARWTAKAALAGLAVASWWLVPFVAGWDRLVRWEVPFSASWDFGAPWQSGVLSILGLAAVWSARRSAGPARRLALAAGAAVFATLLGELFGYLRPERWMQIALLVAAVATAELADAVTRSGELRAARPAWALIAASATVIFVVIAGRLEAIPLAVWLLWWPNRSWAITGAIAWASALIWVPFWNPAGAIEEFDANSSPLEAIAASGEPTDEGLVYTDLIYDPPSGFPSVCPEGQPWRTAPDTEGRIRPLLGLYIETSHVAEFLVAELGLLGGRFAGYRSPRPHWFDAWESLDRPTVDTPYAAEALGARWIAACSAERSFVVTDLSGTTASGVSVVAYEDHDSWHQAAVEWWLPLAAGISTASNETEEPSLPPVPEPAEGVGAFREHVLKFESRVPIRSSAETALYPVDQPAVGVTLEASGDLLTIRADVPGWVWLRIPWDPDWRSLDGTPVQMGGPAHLVVWAQDGETELRWSVARGVDVAVGIVTGLSILGLVALQVTDRRRGTETPPRRRRPAADAVEIFADTVDQWVYSASTWARKVVSKLSSRGLT